MKVIIKSYYFIIFLIVIGCFGYIGSIYAYHSTVRYMGILLIILLVYLFFKRKLIMHVPKMWMVVWIYIGISSLFLNFPDSVRYLIVFTLGMIMIMFFKAYKDMNTLIIKCFIIVGGFYVIGTLLQVSVPSLFYRVLSILQSPSLYEQTISYYNRYGAYCGFAGESSFNAFSISIGILCVISKCFSDNKLKPNRLVYIAAAYYAILLTDKRSFLMLIPMIIFGMFFLYAICEKKKNTTIIMLFLLIVTPVLFSTVLGNALLRILASGKGSNPTGIIDLSNREIFWNLSFDMLKTKPIFGHGLMSYDNFYNAFFHKSLTFAGGHNSYFQLLGEMGFVGATLFFIAIIRSLVNSIRNVWTIKKYKINIDVKLKKILFCSIFIQILCITYGLSGNPFHRPQQLLTYFVSVAIGIYVDCIIKELESRLDKK